MGRTLRFKPLMVSLSLALLAAHSANAAGDAVNGKTAFGRCAICHKTTAGSGNGIGPNLFGIVGRKAGSIPGFDYSDAMKKSDITWTIEKLAAYITSPKGVVPGNRMPYAGASSASQADDVAAYLGTLH